MTQLVKYEAARAALAIAATFDEVLEIKDVAERMALYARQAQDNELMEKATEIRLRAERRAGEMLRESAEKGQRATRESNLRQHDLPKSLAGTSEPVTLEDIGITKNQSSRWQKIAAIPEEKFEAFIAEKKAEGKAVTADEVIRRVVAEEKREANAALPRIPLPEGKYNVIVIDPPWPMEKIEREVRPNQVAFEYPTMTLDELAVFPVPTIAADDCHLFCWTTQRFLPDALELLKDWGFRYVLTMVWHKPGGFQPVGLPQYNCEMCVYARRGTPKFTDTKNFFCCFDAPRGEHSRKPDEFYDTIRRVTEGRRIDVFSREPREGFEQHGNETGKFAAA